ncbi:hypothetical protein M513_05910 [Trichuris suis]|uniref:Uncharacterized protein n=1 Tax=Trichuris suis TaxID=68888 RepID=A0A085M7K4_9BILA|nr:hypothetical protein M513_05910 [Trichuris suis]
MDSRGGQNSQLPPCKDEERWEGHRSAKGVTLSCSSFKRRVTSFQSDMPFRRMTKSHCSTIGGNESALILPLNWVSSKAAINRRLRRRAIKTDPPVRSVVF